MGGEEKTTPVTPELRLRACGGEGKKNEKGALGPTIYMMLIPFLFFNQQAPFFNFTHGIYILLLARSVGHALSA